MSEDTHHTFCRCIQSASSSVSVGSRRSNKIIINDVSFYAGFDTASSIALLAVSALGRRGSDGKPIPAAHIVILPVEYNPPQIECSLNKTHASCYSQPG